MDYITKPFQPEEIKARIRTHNTLRSIQKIMPHWQEISELVIEKDVKQFADQLRHIAKKYDFQTLIDYGNDLYDQMSVYDIYEAKSLMEILPVEIMKRMDS